MKKKLNEHKKNNTFTEYDYMPTAMCSLYHSEWPGTKQLYKHHAFQKDLFYLYKRMMLSIQLDYFDQKLITRKMKWKRKLLKVMFWLLKMKECLFFIYPNMPPIKSQDLQKIQSSQPNLYQQDQSRYARFMECTNHSPNQLFKEYKCMSIRD